MTVCKQSVKSLTTIKNREEQVVSLNKRVKNTCQKNKESSAKLANTLYHFYRKNLEEGGDGTSWTDMGTLGRLMGRSSCTVGRGLRELESQGLFLIQRVRWKNHQIKLRVVPTETFLKIKNCGQTSHLSEQVAEINYSETPQISRHDKPILPPILIRKYKIQLNNAYACQTKNLPKNENKSSDPVGCFPEVNDLSSQDLPRTEENCSFAEEALKAVKEILLPVLDHPVILVETTFKKAVQQLQKSHFGDDPVVALERFREYLTKVANNPFLTGKKAMKSSDLFLISIGFLLTPKTIEDSWHNAHFFEIWEEKSPSCQILKKDPISDSTVLPTLSLEEALTKAETSVDKEVKESLYQTLGPVTYQAWIHSTDFVATRSPNGEMDFSINSAFARDYVLTHYGSQVRKAFSRFEETHESWEGAAGDFCLVDSLQKTVGVSLSGASTLAQKILHGNVWLLEKEARGDWKRIE